MTSSSQTPEPQSSFDRPAPVSSDQLLPPVEPPSAGFLLQLFVVPAVIVAGVVLVWFTIESMARGGEQDPDAIVKALRGANGFQQAKDLADMLGTPERYSLHKNRDLAQKLAAYLDELVEQGDDFARAGDDRYRVRIDSAGDYERLFADLEERGALPTRVLFLWPLDLRLTGET